MNSQTRQPAPKILQKQQTRREAVLLGVSALMAASGVTALAAVIGWEMPVRPIFAASADPAPHPAATSAGSSLRPLSTVHKAIVETYRDRYAIFGDTSSVEVTLMDDVNKQEIELPRVMMGGALGSIVPRTARGDVIEIYGRYKTFVTDYLDRDDSGADTALALYNAYDYLSLPLYRAERNALQDRLHEPEELFAAAFTVWRLFPDAFLERYNALPTVPNGNELQMPRDNAPIVRPSWEKQLALLAADNTLRFAAALVKSSPDEGEGLVSKRLARVAPRLGIIKYQMDL